MNIDTTFNKREVRRPIFVFIVWIFLISSLILAIPACLLSWLVTGEDYVTKDNNSYNFAPPWWTICVGIGILAALIIFL